MPITTAHLLFMSSAGSRRLRVTNTATRLHASALVVFSKAKVTRLNARRVQMAGTATTLVHVESKQTAVPTRVTAHGAGRTLPIVMPSGAPLTAAALQRRFRAVL
ncbi:hypothetical protein GUJ93_ZPchr0004g40151 [Zizania palustris]|uniref:Uncharacterized protein n=1 Tax=Zizania palustris TaxID=103762 RepID=A0A8J5T116_ZIZPA|nr:hypothetical protein GUJ93_ZPchr0004g40151 [Zizania palustris]